MAKNAPGRWLDDENAREKSRFDESALTGRLRAVNGGENSDGGNSEMLGGQADGTARIAIT